MDTGLIFLWFLQGRGPCVRLGRQVSAPSFPFPVIFLAFAMFLFFFWGFCWEVIKDCVLYYPAEMVVL